MVCKSTPYKTPVSICRPSGCAGIGEETGRKNMKKHLLALMLILGCLLSVLTPAVHAEEPELTRIGWVQQLVKTFDMTVEDDNYPDNY